ncbi:MAG: phosphotransferase, partial [Acidimicrobiales bacterium]
IGRDREATVAAETHACRVVAASGGLDRYLVPLRHFDADRSIAVFDLVPSATSWRDHYLRTRRFHLTLARQLGSALARLHGRTTSPGDRSQLRRGPAEVLALHRPSSSVLASTSRAGLDVVAIAQTAPGLGDALDEAVIGWRYEAVIHGDVRWDNCLVLARPGSTRTTRLKLIDWELARFGDPAWDIGSVFADYLGAWIGALPAADQKDPARAFDLGRIPLHRIHRPVQAFWEAYKGGGTDASDDRAELQIRSAAMAGARLIQNALERADRRTRLPALSVILLQLGFNTLSRPEDATAHLLGLNVGGAA